VRAAVLTALALVALLPSVDAGPTSVVLRGGPIAVCRDLAFSPDGALLASAYKSEVIVWDLAAAKPAWRAKGVAFGDQCLAFTRDGKTLFVLDYDGDVRAFDAAGGVERKADRIAGGAGNVLGGIVASPDGNWLAIGYGHPHPDPGQPSAPLTAKRLRLHSLEMKVTVSELEIQGSVAFLRFAPTSDILAYRTVARLEKGYGGGCYLLRVPGDEVRELPLVVSDLAFSPDGKTIYAAVGDEVLVLDAEDPGGEPQRRWKHAGRFPALEITADGSLLATAGVSIVTKDPWVRLWDTQTGNRVGEFKSDPKETSSLAFSPDGRRLAVGGKATLKVHDVASLRK
jgi:WD40 repeat protein